jgi:hypothetical protein
MLTALTSSASDAVALCELLQPLEVGGRLFLEELRRSDDVDFGLMLLGNLAAADLQGLLRALQPSQELRQLHRQGSATWAAVSLTAPTLKKGCFDTGSQPVTVSSLAARARPSGCEPAG